MTTVKHTRLPADVHDHCSGGAFNGHQRTAYYISIKLWIVLFCSVQHQHFARLYPNVLKPEIVKETMVQFSACCSEVTKRIPHANRSKIYEAFLETDGFIKDAITALCKRYFKTA